MSAQKVLICDKIENEVVELLKKHCEVVFDEVSPEKLLSVASNYSALLVRSRTQITAEVVKAGAKSLMVIGRAGIGVDNINVKAATAHKIPVVYAPTGSTNSVAELTISMMLALARRLNVADSTMKAGQWEKNSLKGAELSEKTLGVIGTGRIGLQVVKIAKAIGMKTIGYDPYIPKDVANNLGLELVDLHILLKSADVITIHVPMTKDTKGMIGATQFAKMKKTAYIINCARGGIIDEKALYDALKNKMIAGAGLDVYENEPPSDSPLLKLDNIVLTPHIGANTKEAQVKAGMITAEQIIKVLKGERPDLLVNKEIYN